MEVTLIRYAQDADQLAGEAAALCYKGKNPKRSLDIALDGGHESVMEHASFIFLVEGVSRVLLAQITRHRLASFSVESQRYCGANLDLVIPDSMCICDLVNDIVAVKKAINRLYDHARALGVPHEDCRYMTLQAGKTSSRVIASALCEVQHVMQNAENTANLLRISARSTSAGSWRQKWSGRSVKANCGAKRTLKRGECYG